MDEKDIKKVFLGYAFFRPPCYLVVVAIALMHAFCLPSIETIGMKRISR